MLFSTLLKLPATDWWRSASAAISFTPKITVIPWIQAQVPSSAMLTRVIFLYLPELGWAVTGHDGNVPSARMAA